MKTQFTFLLFIIFTAFAYGQTHYNLEIAAEGNFGSTNADVHTVTNTTGSTSVSLGMYQTANNSTGFDVLQDYGVAGNKALLIEKPAGAGRVVIVDYPAFTEVHTFSTSNAPQTLVMASPTKGYVSTGNPATIQFVDMNNNTISAVTDPNGDISSYSSNMVSANGTIYTEIGDKIVKVDNLTQAVSDVITPGIGSIKGLTFDDQTNLLWAMNGSGSLISIDIMNNDALGTEVITGVSGSTLLRIFDSKLYFWTLSNKELFIYNTVTPSTLPLVSSYTSTMAGASWSFGYGRSFDIDQNTGDFAICSADGFVAPSLFEVVDGTLFTVIDLGDATGVAIANKCRLETFPAGSGVPIPDVASLPTINEECEVTLTAPTADGGAIIATTNDPLTYSSQGSYTVTWTYTNANGTETQTQDVIIEDVTAPVADVAILDELEINCDSLITNLPAATDNCDDAIVGTTSSPLSYSTEGTYVITWVYSDSAGNETQQTQTVIVSCETSSLNAFAINNFKVYPNPATDYLNIEIQEGEFYGELLNVHGQKVINIENNNKVYVDNLPNGVYYLKLTTNGLSATTRKVIIQ